MNRIINSFAASFKRTLPLCFALAIAFIFTLLPFSAHAASPQDSVAIAYSQQYSNVLNYLANGSAPVFGSEWRVFTLARSGRLQQNSNFALNYYQQIEDRIRTQGSATLDSNKSTENSRLIIALTSLGVDARNVAGYDLTSPLSDFNYVKHQGINGTIFALIALQSRSIYAMNSIKNKCIDFILEREISGGGWAMVGNNPDPDITSMAITALAPYYKSLANVKSAVERAITKLSSMQDPNGGFSSYGTANSESCAQVIVALSTLGIDAGSDSRFVKNSKSVVEALLKYFSGTGFAHTINGGVNGVASEQAAYSLCAYDRYKNTRSSLYNMNDVHDTPPIIPTTSPSDQPTPTPTPTPMPTPTLTPTLTPTPTSTPTSTPRPTPTLTPTPTPKPTSTPWQATATPALTSTPKPTFTPNAATPTPSLTPTETPHVSPSTVLPTDIQTSPFVSEQPELTPDADDTEAPMDIPDETLPFETAVPTADPDLTFNPINISSDNWNGTGTARREKLKWLIPAGIGGILLVSGVFLIAASRKREQ